MKIIAFIKDFLHPYVCEIDITHITELNSEIKKLKEQVLSYTIEQNPDAIKWNNRWPKSPITYRAQVGEKRDVRNLIHTKSFILDSVKNTILKSIPVNHTPNDIAKAVFNWVSANIGYKSDSILYNEVEYWASPELTYQKKYGDCLIWNTKLLTPSKELINISDIKEGDLICGKDGEFHKVINKWYKGKLPTKKIILNNGSEIIATDDHKFILENNTEVLCKDLKINDILKQIKNIKTYPEEINKEYWYLKGLFIADGWADKSKKNISISGKDGYKKEKQKKWVKDYCERKNINYYWHERYITIHSKELFEDFKKCGIGAENKHIGVLPQAKENIEAMLNGLKADAYIREDGSITFGTTSERLKNEIRILYRMIGKSVHERLWVPSKTSFGKKSIWRIIVRTKKEIRARVKGIIENCEEEVYDIEVENHEIYLPQKDIVVHNCDDHGLLIASLCRMCGIPAYRIKVAAGNVITSAGKGGHAYAIYLADDNEWYTLDSTFYPRESKLNFLTKPQNQNERYSDIWFTFNDLWCWAQKSFVYIKTAKS